MKGVNEDTRLLGKESSSSEYVGGAETVANSLCRSSPALQLSVIMMVVLIGDMARGIFSPTLWAYVDLLGGNKATLGYCVAGFSFGRVLISPLLGKWSEEYGPRRVLSWATLTIAVGCLLYASADSTTDIIAAQIIMGLGSGTLGATRSFVALRTTPERRTSALAELTALQYTGFAVMPALGGALCWMLQEETHDITPTWFVELTNGGTPRWQISIYNLPALVMFSVCIVTTIAVLSVLGYAHEGVYAQVDVDVERGTSEDTNSKQDARCVTQSQTYAPTDRIEIEKTHPPASSTACNTSAAIVCLALNVTTKGSIAVFETLGPRLAVQSYGLTPAQCGMLFAISGAVGVGALLSFRHICRFANDVTLVVGGICTMAVGCAIISAPLTHGVGRSLFCLGVFLVFAIGYPIGHTALLGLFSKAVGTGKGKQGEMLGYFGSVGSLARICFPVAAALLSSTGAQEESGHGMLFTSRLVFFILTIISASSGLVLYLNRGIAGASL